MGGAKKLKPQASSSLGAWWLPWWLSLRGTDKKKIGNFHKSLLRQTPKNPPVQKGSAASTKLQIVNSKQRASNLTENHTNSKKKKKGIRQGSICQTSESGIPQVTSLQELTIRKFSLLPPRDSKNRAVQTVKVSKFPHKTDTDLPLPILCQKLRCH